MSLIIHNILSQTPIYFNSIQKNYFELKSRIESKSQREKERG